MPAIALADAFLPIPCARLAHLVEMDAASRRVIVRDIVSVSGGRVGVPILVAHLRIS